MFKQSLKLFAGTCAIAACATVAAPQAAQAWTYGMDSAYDGTGGGLNGQAHGVGPQSKYEAFGMAYTANDDTVTFAFNANFGLAGHYHGGAADKNIGWGDLFLNLDPTQTFNQAKASGNVLGIRFSANNDSLIGGTQTGVFTDITTAGVAGSNSGWSNYNKYSNYVNKKGGSVETIDGMSNSEAQSYLGIGSQTNGDNVLSGGTKVGDVSVLTSSDLDGMGLDFGSQGGTGTDTFGFSFARSLLPGGDLRWVAHVMAECTNDTVGMYGEFAAQTPPPGHPGNPNEAVPEPFSMVGAGLALSAGAVLKNRKKK
ncbi:MAG: PEP-CTERM sorting domain-containing protein [Cyanobacteria bacterium P01_G01_bin.54]